MHKIKLIVTDLDGTLTGNDNELVLSGRLAELLETYRSQFGTVWAVCSGRSARGVRGSIEELQQMGLHPDYVIFRSASIYRADRYHWRPMYTWNVWLRIRMIMRFFHQTSVMREWHRKMEKTFRNVVCVYRRRQRLCLRFRNNDDALAGAEMLRRQKGSVCRHLQVHQYLSDVEVRSKMHTKGIAVEELANMLHVAPSETLCIGNGTSDITMLDGSFAAHTGCVANSEMDVIDQVHQVQGYIATAKSMAGVVEILAGYLSGDIQSDLPSWWSPAHMTKHPRMGQSRRHPPPRKHMPARERRTLQVGLLAAYAVLAVFASFGLLPFSNIIMKPFVMVTEWLVRLFEFFL